MPVLENTLESKVALETQLNASIERLIRKINLVEKNMLMYMYKRKSNLDTITFEQMDDIEFLMKHDLLNKDVESEPEVETTTTTKPTERATGLELSNLAAMAPPEKGMPRMVEGVGGTKQKKRRYAKTKKYGRKLRLKSRRKT